MLKIGTELLSPKNLPGSVLSGLCQAFAGCTAAALGADAFHSPALTVPGTEEYWCCLKAGTSSNPQNQYHWTKKWERRNTSWT